MTPRPSVYSASEYEGMQTHRDELLVANQELREQLAALTGTREGNVKELGEVYTQADGRRVDVGVKYDPAECPMYVVRAQGGTEVVGTLGDWDEILQFMREHDSAATRKAQGRRG